MTHPINKAERRRSAEAKALEHLHQRKINGKKRKIYVDLKEKETEDDLRNYLDTQEVAGPATGTVLGGH